MTKQTLQQYTNLPKNILPTKDQMIEYILKFQEATGAGYIETSGITDIISIFRMAQEYFRPAKAKATYLDMSKANIERFED